MRRLLLGPLAVLVLVLGLALAPPISRAADLPYAGTWKITVLDRVDQKTATVREFDVWLVKLDKEGKKVELVSALPGFDKTKFAEYKPDAKTLRVTMQTNSGLGLVNLYAYPVKGKADQMVGSMRLNLSSFWRVRLEKTEAKTIEQATGARTMAGSADFQAALQTKDLGERIAALRDVLKDHEGKPITYTASQYLVFWLINKKAPAAEIKAPAKVFVDQSALYGRECEVGGHLVLAQMLMNYDKTLELSLAHARKAVELGDDKDPKGLTITSYMVLIQALEKNKKTDEIKALVEKAGKAAEASIALAKEPEAKLGTTQVIAQLLLSSTNPGIAELGLKHARQAIELVKDKEAPVKFNTTRVVAQLLLTSKVPSVADAGLEYARQLVKLVPDDAPAGQKLMANHLLSAALMSRDKADDFKAQGARVEKLEDEIDKAWIKDAIPFKLDKFAGRKGKSDRVVLVELFTGAQCPPCVSADIAFDAALKTYPARDVVFLQYHLHIPGPDPLTNPDSEARAKFYGEDASGGTPSMWIDGKLSDPMGGFKEHAKDRYEKLRDLIDKQLEEASEAKIKLKATRQGDKVEVTADVSDLKKPKGKTRLRLVLVEDQARFEGRNKQRRHHHVVRDFLGGMDGFKLEKASATHKASVDLWELRKKLDRYLATSPARGIGTPDRPLALRHLKVVAIIQDDESKKVYQAAQVDVPGK